MSEQRARDRRRNIVSFDIDEVETENGGADHLVSVSASYGGMNIAVQATLDQIRDFFTKKREHSSKKTDLKAV